MPGASSRPSPSDTGPLRPLSALSSPWRTCVATPLEEHREGKRRGDGRLAWSGAWMRQAPCSVSGLLSHYRLVWRGGSSGGGWVQPAYTFRVPFKEGLHATLRPVPRCTRHLSRLAQAMSTLFHLASPHTKYLNHQPPRVSRNHFTKSTDTFVPLSP